MQTPLSVKPFVLRRGSDFRHGVYHLPMRDDLSFTKRREEVYKKYEPILHARDTTRQEKNDLTEQMHEEIQKIAEDESRAIDARLFARAQRLDIELPLSTEKELWQGTEKAPFLSIKGRLALRRSIVKRRRGGVMLPHGGGKP